MNVAAVGSVGRQPIMIGAGQGGFSGHAVLPRTHLRYGPDDHTAVSAMVNAVIPGTTVMLKASLGRSPTVSLLLPSTLDNAAVAHVPALVQRLSSALYDRGPSRPGFGTDEIVVYLPPVCFTGALNVALDTAIKGSGVGKVVVVDTADPVRHQWVLESRETAITLAVASIGSSIELIADRAAETISTARSLQRLWCDNVVCTVQLPPEITPAEESAFLHAFVAQPTMRHGVSPCLPRWVFPALMLMGVGAFGGGFTEAFSLRQIGEAADVEWSALYKILGGGVLAVGGGIGFVTQFETDSENGPLHLPITKADGTPSALVQRSSSAFWSWRRYENQVILAANSPLRAVGTTPATQRG